MPGVANHNKPLPTTHIKVKKASHGFLRPAWSAMAPKMGAPIAITKPAKLIILPHWAVPTSTFSAMAFVKYAAKIKVCIITKYELFAQSYNVHASSPFNDDLSPFASGVFAIQFFMLECVPRFLEYRFTNHKSKTVF